MTDLSVIIVNWNTRELLAQCLQSVYDTAGDLVLEVFVVDNASTDGSAAMVRERFPLVRLIENAENVGFARANNQALRLASGRYLLLLNSDTEVRPGALEALVTALESHPEAGAAGPRMVSPNGSWQNSYGNLPSVLSEILGPYLFDVPLALRGAVEQHLFACRRQSLHYVLAERVSFACTLIRRQALDQVGLLDERFGHYSEDYDWFLRLKRAGWRVVFCPEAHVVHYWGASSSLRGEWALRQLYQSKRLYYKKNYGTLAERVLCLGLAGRFCLRAFLACLSWPLQRATSMHTITRQVRLARTMLLPADSLQEE